MKYNDQIDTEVTDSTSEPLSLDEIKEHLSLKFDTSGSYQFNDDDNYLQTLGRVARELLEQYTGLSFMEKGLRSIVRNECGNIEIPFGPVNDVTAVFDKDGNDITSSAVIRGLKFKWVVSPCSDYLVIEYLAGYSELPFPLKQAMLEEIAYRYENRGDGTNKYAGEVIGISQGSMNLAAPYKRKSMIA
jgi:hypothetical protein